MFIRNLRMGNIVIHPTHRKMIHILREKYKEGKPVVLMKEDVDNLFKLLPTLNSPTMRNQSVYRLLLNAMNRSFSELQQHKNFYVLNHKAIKVVEKIYSKVERKHLCYTLLDSLRLFLIRRRII